MLQRVPVLLAFGGSAFAERMDAGFTEPPSMSRAP